jgi:pimeloyl-ACP methyl ester carboxylesterase
MFVLRTNQNHRLDHRWIPGTDPSAPTLVFLHQGLGSISTWRDFPDRVVAETGASALVYSRLGHGHSDPLTEPRGLDYLHREALEVLPSVLDQMGIDDPLLIGHSDGASIALIFAAASGWPLRGAIIEAPHIFVEPITLAGVRQMTETARTTDLLERLKRHHRSPEPLFRAWSDTWLEPSFAGWNIESLLPDIECPLLLIQGEDDEYGTPEQVHAIARQISASSQTLLLPGCGHTPHRDRAELVLKVQADFIRRIIAESKAANRTAKDRVKEDQRCAALCAP